MLIWRIMCKQSSIHADIFENYATTTLTVLFITVIMNVMKRFKCHLNWGCLNINVKTDFHKKER